MIRSMNGGSPVVLKFTLNCNLGELCSWTVQKADVERDVIPPLNSLLLMFQGPSNIIRKRYDKLLDYENSSDRLGSLKDSDVNVSAVSVTTLFVNCQPAHADMIVVLT